MKPLPPTIAFASLLLLVGCAADGAPGAGPAESEPDPAQPVALLDVACADLLTEDAISDAFGTDVPERAPYVEGYGGFSNVAISALTLAGATRCAWGDGNGPGDHYLELELLPHSAADFDRWEDDISLFQPNAAGAGDVGWLSCNADADGDGCRADILVGGVWISAIAYGLDGTDAIGQVLENLSTVVATSDAAEAEPVGPNASCDALLPTDTVRASVGDDLDAWTDRGAVTQPVIWRAAFERAGGVFCSWRNGFDSSTARTVDLAVLPGAESVFAAHFATDTPDTVTQAEIPGGFSGLYASPFHDAVDAYASILVGSTWVDVWVNDEGSDDDREAALDLAAAVTLP